MIWNLSGDRDMKGFGIRCANIGTRDVLKQKSSLCIKLKFLHLITEMNLVSARYKEANLRGTEMETWNRLQK